MYFERPFKIDGVFFAIVDGEKIEISREVAKAMLCFYRNELHRQKQWAYVEEDEADQDDNTAEKAEEKVQAEIDETFGDVEELIDELRAGETGAEKTERKAAQKEKKTGSSGKKNKKGFKPSEVLETVLTGRDSSFSLEYFADNRVDVEKEVVQKAVYEDMKKSYQLLNDNEKHLIDCIYFKEMSHEEVAAILHVTRSAVTKRLHKVLKKMRKDLENKGY